MRAVSFTGRVIAVLSRRAPAFQPPDTPGPSVGWAHLLQAAVDRIRRRRTAARPQPDTPGDTADQTAAPETTPPVPGTDSPTRSPDPSRLRPGADLRGADLTDADLTSANLTSAHLDGAHLHRADLTNADLTDTSLDRAVGLEVRQLAGARWSSGTTWPEHLRDRIRADSVETGAGAYRVRSDEGPDREASPVPSTTT